MGIHINEHFRTMESASGLIFNMKMQIHHIGGIKDCGPAEQLTMLKEDAHWTFYDADEESLRQTNIENKDYNLIAKAIGKEDEILKFNVMSSPSASSFLLPEESAKDMIIQGTEETWGDHTKIIKNINLDVNKIDTLRFEDKIEQIDVLSIDTQGMELDILKGATLHMDEVLAVISEVEFRRLYKDQPLFYEMFEYLNKQGFDMWAIYNLQYFNKNNYPKPLRGFGVQERHYS